MHCDIRSKSPVSPVTFVRVTKSWAVNLTARLGPQQGRRLDEGVDTDLFEIRRDQKWINVNVLELFKCLFKRHQSMFIAWQDDVQKHNRNYFWATKNKKKSTRVSLILSNFLCRKSRFIVSVTHTLLVLQINLGKNQFELVEMIYQYVRQKVSNFPYSSLYS